MRRVFVFWKYPIFHESVCLLLNHPGVRLLGDSSDWVSAHSEILELRPDTILVEVENGDVPGEITEMLEEISWNVRIICLGLTSNTLNVYYREQEEVKEVDDLLHFILGAES